MPEANGQALRRQAADPGDMRGDVFLQTPPHAKEDDRLRFGAADEAAFPKTIDRLRIGSFSAHVPKNRPSAFGPLPLCKGAFAYAPS